MQLSLGIDTGGTYTDAVLFHAEHGVVAKAKSLTTRHDLSIGIAGAVDAVMARTSSDPADIALVSLSTTLATNALVEGRGGRVALVFIGFGDNDANRAGLAEAMQGDPLIRLVGGHNPQGDPLAPLDLATLEREALAVAPSVSGFAVTAQFATRNPEHEVAARDLLQRITTLPVTCGHELSAKLNGPRRALTSVLNARLIGVITGLIAAAEAIMADHGIAAPLMVVRGDGALMSAAVAKTRPIETILSGPAASVVGATFLTGAHDAIVADIGGTTTDVAVVTGGMPSLDGEGATVGGFRTMVEAVAMTTVGLGGDSEVAVGLRGVVPEITLGPRRVIPISLLAVEHGETVHRVLDQQLLQDIAHDHDGCFVVPIAEAGASTAGLDDAELMLLERARRDVAPISQVLRGHADARRVERLVRRGLLMISAFTPTDASHVLGDDRRFDAGAAAKAATLIARRRTLLGKAVAEQPETLAAMVVTALQRRSAEVLLDVGLAIDGFDGAGLSRNPLLAASLEGRHGVVDVSARLTVPIIGLGASAALHYPAVVAMLRTEGTVPADADVANAIGAVVGQVRAQHIVYVSQSIRGLFRVHHADEAGVEPHCDVGSADEARLLAERFARAEALRLADAAGAADAQVVVAAVINVAHVEGEELFVDATITAVASGRPRLDHP